MNWVGGGGRGDQEEYFRYRDSADQGHEAGKCWMDLREVHVVGDPERLEGVTL